MAEREVLNSLDFRKDAIPYMQELVEISREIVQLGVLDRGEVLIIERNYSPEAITLNLALRDQVHCTAAGKVLLAGLSVEDAVKILQSKGMPRRTVNTITDITRMIANLEKVRKQGFAIDAEETAEGVRAIAAPVYNHTGSVISALSIVGPSTRLSLERIYRLVNLLKETCTSISAQFRYRSYQQKP